MTSLLHHIPLAFCAVLLLRQGIYSYGATAVPPNENATCPVNAEVDGADDNCVGIARVLTPEDEKIYLGGKSRQVSNSTSRLRAGDMYSHNEDLLSCGKSTIGDALFRLSCYADATVPILQSPKVDMGLKLDIGIEFGTADQQATRALADMRAKANISVGLFGTFVPDYLSSNSFIIFERVFIENGQLGSPICLDVRMWKVCITLEKIAFYRGELSFCPVATWQIESPAELPSAGMELLCFKLDLSEWASPSPSYRAADIDEKDDELASCGEEENDNGWLLGTVRALSESLDVKDPSVSNEGETGGEGKNPLRAAESSGAPELSWSCMTTKIEYEFRATCIGFGSLFRVLDVKVEAFIGLRITATDEERPVDLRAGFEISPGVTLPLIKRIEHTFVIVERVFINNGLLTAPLCLNVPSFKLCLVLKNTRLPATMVLTLCPAITFQWKTAEPELPPFGMDFPCLGIDIGASLFPPEG